MTIDAMTAGDWPAVRAIYEEGIAARLPHLRLVVRDHGQVIAWAWRDTVLLGVLAEAAAK